MAGRHKTFDHLRDPVRPKARLDTEPAVQPLLLCPKETGRIGHRDDLGPVDIVAVSAAHDGRQALGKHVFQPVGALTVGEGNLDAAVVVDSGNWCLVRLPCLPADVAHDRCAGPLLAG